MSFIHLTVIAKPKQVLTREQHESNLRNGGSLRPHYEDSEKHYYFGEELWDEGWYETEILARYKVSETFLHVIARVSGKYTPFSCDHRLTYVQQAMGDTNNPLQKLLSAAHWDNWLEPEDLTTLYAALTVISEEMSLANFPEVMKGFVGAFKVACQNEGAHVKFGDLR